MILLETPFLVEKKGPSPLISFVESSRSPLYLSTCVSRIHLSARRKGKFKDPKAWVRYAGIIITIIIIGADSRRFRPAI